MPTDEERREVAARLRILSGHREVDKEFVHEALGLYMGECVDGYDPVSVSELADLIEPEERTCRMIDNGVELCCSECDGRHAYDDEPNYCMRCGAKVVGQ